MAAKKKTMKKTPARRPATSKAKSKTKKSGSAGRGRRVTRKPSPKPKRPPARRPRPVRDNPEALALAKVIAGVASDKKATDVTILDVRARGSSVGYDYIVLASGDSDRQLYAISEALRETLKPQGLRASSVKSSADWVAIDCDDVVAHLFTPEKRALYDFEGMWTDAPRLEVAP